MAILTHSYQKTRKGSADRDQTPHNPAFDHGLHSLLTGLSIRKKNKSDKIDPTPLK